MTRFHTVIILFYYALPYDLGGEVEMEMETSLFREEQKNVFERLKFGTKFKRLHVTALLCHCLELIKIIERTEGRNRNFNMQMSEFEWNIIAPDSAILFWKYSDEYSSNN